MKLDDVCEEIIEHGCGVRVLAYDDPSRCSFGWVCAGCGKEWFIGFSAVKLSCRSRFKLVMEGGGSRGLAELLTVMCSRVLMISEEEEEV